MLVFAELWLFACGSLQSSWLSRADMHVWMGMIQMHTHIDLQMRARYTNMFALE